MRWCMLVFLMLAACSPPVATTSPQAPTAITTAAPSETSALFAPTPTGEIAMAPTQAPPAPAEPPAPAVPTLTIYADAGDPTLAFVRAMAQEWGAASNFEVRVLPKQPDALRLDLAMAALAGQAPDLVLASTDAVAPLVVNDLLEPVDDWFNAADFAEPVVAAANIAGTRWGVPLSVEGQLLLLYNKKLIGAPPTTTGDLLKTPRPEAAEATLITNQNDPRWLLPWLNGFGGQVLGDDGRPALNTPPMAATYTFLRQLRADGVSPETDFATGAEQFKLGKAAMIVDGDWSIPWYLDAARNAPDLLDLGVARLPVVSATNRVAASYVGGRYILVPRDAADANRERARALVDYLTGAEAQARIVTQERRLPARLETLQGEAVQNDALLKPQADSLVEALPFPTQPAYAALWDALGSRTGAVMVGDISPQTAAEEIQAAAAAALAQ